MREIPMSGSDKRAQLAAEELLAIAEMQRDRIAQRMALRPSRPKTSKQPSASSDGFDRAASRLEAKAQREVADQRAGKAKTKLDVAVAASGVGPKVRKAVKLVPDPYKAGEAVPAVVNLAEHPLEMMLHRRRLDAAQYEAGVRFRRIYEAAAIGPGRGIDPAHIKVDGGKLGDPLSDSVVHAQFELKAILPRLGKRGSEIVLAICGRGLTISELAERYAGYASAKQNVSFITLRLHEALDFLAEEVWGAKGPARGQIVGMRADVVIYDEHAVEVANQSYLRKRGITGCIRSSDTP